MKTKLLELKVKGGVRACTYLDTIEVDGSGERICRVNVAVGWERERDEWKYKSLWVAEGRLSEISVVSPKESTNTFEVGDKVIKLALIPDEYERGWFESYGLTGTVIEHIEGDVLLPYRIEFSDGTKVCTNGATIKKI